MYETFKALLVVLFSAIASFLSPIWGFIYAALAVFLLNFIIGYVTDLRVNKANFDLKKAKECIADAAMFFVAIAAMLFVGNNIDNSSGALNAISTTMYVVLYFYSVNVFKNLKQLYPKSKWIAFIYWLIAFEFLKKVPFLEEFFKSNPEADPRNQNTEKNG